MVAVVLLISISSPVSHAIYASAMNNTGEAITGIQSQSSSTSLFNITITTSDSLKVVTPEYTNITLLSASGNQYDLGSFVSGGQNIFLFTPLQKSDYSLSVNISSPIASYVQIGTTGLDSASDYSKNISMPAGILRLNLGVQVINPPSSTQSSSWNPLVGFTGINLAGITLGGTDIAIIFGLFSILLIALGMRFNQKLLYFGIFCLAVLGIVEVGVLFVGLLLGSYILGFFVIRSYFGYRGKKRSTPNV